ncbi:MAG: family 20 glycosylhydrolase, partial [Acidobacteriaceae bacterium]
MVTRDTDFSPKRTRRDFLASGIVGLAGSTIFAGRGNGIHPNSSADSPVGPLPSEDAGQNNPGKAQRAAGGLYWWFEDAARLPADPSYYRRVIDFCHDWKLNGCVLSLTDDQGCALKFKSHPELITHKNALTDKQAKALADYAQQQGVDLVPLIESFGHTRYITDVPQYAYLEDRMPGAKHNFSSVSPVASETLKLISDLYREAAEIFPAPYLHGDCDEVNWGGSELSRKALKTKSRDEIWANYINYLDHAARGVGKQFIISGDNVVHKRPEILPRLNKDIIVMDWHYYATAPEPLEQGARKIIGAGLRAIGG